MHAQKNHRMTTPANYTSLLAAWDISPATTTVEAIQENVQLISLSDGKMVVLKHVSAIDEAIIKRLDFERDVLHHVEQQGMPVATPLLTKTGKPYHIASNQVYRLSYWLQNNFVEPRTDDERAQLYRNYGAAIARFHLALASYHDDDILNRTWQTSLKKRVLDQAAPAVLSHLDSSLLPAFTTSLKTLEPDMTLAFQDLPEQLIIWDCHPGNVAVNGIEVTGFVDCDLISISSRIQDIAYFLVHLIKWDIGNLQKEQTWIALFPQLVQGYESISKLSAKEHVALYFAMIGTPLVFMDFFFQQNTLEPIKHEIRLFDWLMRHRSEIQSGLST
jgi:Ser/Thr protein kinase RdoA (MazF antagonist)